MARNLCHLFALFQRKWWDLKSRYVSLRKNPAGSPENKKISYPGKGTRFGKHLFFTCLKIEYTLCASIYDFFCVLKSLTSKKQTIKFSSANFKKMLIQAIRRLDGKQCRSRWGGSLWATSSRSTLFANSAFFISGTWRVKEKLVLIRLQGFAVLAGVVSQFRKIVICKLLF